MRICFALSSYLPRVGGVEKHVAGLSAALARQGCEITLISLAPDDGVSRSGSVQLQQYRGCPRSSVNAVSMRHLKALRAAAVTHDVVHVQNLHTLSTLMSVSGLPSNARVVFTPHYMDPNGWIVRLAHAPYDRVFKVALRRVNQVICVTPTEAQSFSDRFGVDPGRITVVPNGTDVRRTSAASVPDPSQHVVFTAGRLERYKQHHLVLRALQFLTDDFILAVAGEGPTRNAIEDEARRDGVQERVRFLGPLSSEEMTAWYQRASVCVSMSNRECFGMTIAEALATGTPVVASDIPAHRDVFDMCGWSSDHLVDVAAPPDVLARRILSAVGAPVDPRSVPSWDDIAEKTLAVYRAALSPGSHRVRVDPGRRLPSR